MNYRTINPDKCPLRSRRRWAKLDFADRPLLKKTEHVDALVPDALRNLRTIVLPCTVGRVNNVREISRYAIHAIIPVTLHSRAR